jgi:hypothetical protein
MKNQILLLIGLLIVQSSMAVTSYSISIDPTIVGETDAEVYIFAKVSSAVTSGSFLLIELPSDVSVSTGTRTCTVTFDPNGDATEDTPSTCRATDSDSVWVSLDQAVAAGGELSMVFDGVTAPSSEKETATFMIYFYASQSTASTLGDSLETGLEISVNSDAFTSTGATQGADDSTATSTVVYATTAILISFTNANAVEAGGFIQVVFPKINPQASSS